jgi:hypothetical protein
MNLFILDRNTIFQHKCILNHFNQYFPQTIKEDGFWQLKDPLPKVLKNYFCYKSSFLKGSFAKKKIGYKLEDIFGPFF